MRPPNSFKVLFVAGYVRSGSTLLDRLLGSVEGAISIGESSLVWERGFRRNLACSCGEPFRMCPFWNDVADVAFGGMASLDVEAVLHARRRIDRWWRIPQMLTRAHGRRFERDRDTYVRHLDKLYSGIAEVGGADLIVDSTKEPSHGLLLLAAGLDLRTVHLVRDPRAVAYSLAVRRTFDPGLGADLPRESLVHAASAWLVTNALVEIAAPRLRRSMTLRYEELVVDPEATIVNVLERAGVVGDSRVKNGSIAFSTGHSVAGNPIRFRSDPVTIRADEEWRRAMPPFSQAVVAAITWPLLRHYDRTRADLPALDAAVAI